MKAFLFEGDLYIRCIPGKNLFKSTMVHEVVNRGDIFALRAHDQVLTIIPGTAQVAHCEWPPKQEEACDGKAIPAEAARKLEFVRAACIRKEYRDKLCRWMLELPSHLRWTPVITAILDRFDRDQRLDKEL